MSTNLIDEPTSRETASSSTLQQTLAPLVAIVVMVAFGVLIRYMLGLTNEITKELQWSRALYLYSGVEAIALRYYQKVWMT